MRWNRTTVQSFLDVRTALLNDNLEDAFRNRYPGFRPPTMIRFCQRLRDLPPGFCMLSRAGIIAAVPRKATAQAESSLVGNGWLAQGPQPYPGTETHKGDRHRQRATAAGPTHHHPYVPPTPRRCGTTHRGFPDQNRGSSSGSAISQQSADDLCNNAPGMLASDLCIDHTSPKIGRKCYVRA
jgi:hypothetical protein